MHQNDAAKVIKQRLTRTDRISPVYSLIGLKTLMRFKKSSLSPG